MAMCNLTIRPINGLEPSDLRAGNVLMRTLVDFGVDIPQPKLRVRDLENPLCNLVRRQVDAPTRRVVEGLTVLSFTAFTLFLGALEGFGCAGVEVGCFTHL